VWFSDEGEFVVAWISVGAGGIAGPGVLEVTRKDLIPELQAVVSRGWGVVDDAILLVAWYEGYFGDRSRFPDVMDYEAAVNGRGIPDIDLIEVGEARVSRLLRRGLAFAWAALHEQRNQLPEVEVAAYVSAAPTLVDPDHFTGNVTFCAERPGWPPYIDPMHSVDEIVVSISTGDCKNPLPPG
jgi:hypothetical protein